MVEATRLGDLIHVGEEFVELLFRGLVLLHCLLNMQSNVDGECVI